ncbi:MAG: transposase [Labilithrix sp.]|nr:transposase [Labilithrix sp.]MCW5815935.1 transposase [Labilithrix sp.]
MKRVPVGPSFRAERVHAAIVDQIAACVARGVRVVHYSVQHDHLHLLVEAQDKKEVARRLQLLFSRIAFAVNRVARRHGSLFRDRHHRRELTSPTETRNVLVYLFFNTRKHAIEHARATNATFELDTMTSAAWFDGWHPIARPPPAAFARARGARASPPTAPPQTWLAAEGWLRGGGPIGFHELPSVPRQLRA